MPNLSFDVMWRDHGAQRGLRDLGRQADSTGKQFKNIGGVLAGAGVGVARFGGMAGAALGAAAGAAGVWGVKVASANEQASISFTTMLGSAAKADKMLRELQAFAATTPFEFPELQTAASSLISAGIEADKVIPIMRTLGDVTSGMGTGSEGVKRATIALQQMSAAGRITGEDLNQLRDAGIPVYDLLAKATGKSKEEVVKLAQAGKLGKRELGQMMSALESGKGLERFSGLMDKQSKSLAGMWSTLTDTLGQGLASIAQQSLPLLKDGLDGVTGVAARMFGWFDKNKDSLSATFRVGGEALQTFGRIVGTVFRSFSTGAENGLGSFERFANYIETHQADITRGLIAGAKVALAFGQALATGASFGLRAFASVIDIQAASTNAMISNMRLIPRVAARAFGWIPGIGEKLKAADRAMDDLHTSAVDGMHGVADGARTAADGIDNKVVPALKNAQGGLDKFARTEIMRAQQRDQAAKAARAIDRIGISADGSKFKLKKFSDITNLSAGEQRMFRGRLDEARGALNDQMASARKAGASQKELTRIWKAGRDELYQEFVQMGLSKKEARKLATEMAGVKPINAKVSTPGMASAREGVQGLDKDINNLNDRTVSATIKYKVADINRLFGARGGSRADLAHAHHDIGQDPMGGVRGGGAPQEVSATAKFSQNPSPGAAFASLTSRRNADQAEFARRIDERVEAAAKKRAAGSAPYGNGGIGAQGSGMAGAIAAGRRLGISSIGTYPGHHPSMARARDFMTNSKAQGDRLAAHLWANRQKYNIWYLIWWRRIISMTRPGAGWRPYFDGNSSNPNRAHTNHVHMVTYDRGGIMRPGQVGINRGASPERVLSPVQTRSFDNLVRVISSQGGATQVHYHITAPNYVGSRDELVRTLTELDRRGRLAVLKR